MIQCEDVLLYPHIFALVWHAYIAYHPGILLDVHYLLALVTVFPILGRIHIQHMGQYKSKMRTSWMTTHLEYDT